MQMTPSKESELIARLHRETVSIPDLQLELELSYKDACSLLDYAAKRQWIAECRGGIDYPVITNRFTLKDLPANVCEKLYDDLEYDDLQVLYYLGDRFSATFQDILSDVDHDSDDMSNAINNLLAAGLIFKHEDHYYCKISKQAVDTVKACGVRQESEMAQRLRRNHN